VPEELVACHDCDLVHRISPHEEGTSGRCIRCGSRLFSTRRNSIERSLALAVAGAVLLVVANSFPFLSFDMQGRVTETTLWSGVRELYDEEMRVLAALVFVTAVLAPAVQLGLLLYVLVPLHWGRVPWQLAGCFRFLRRVQPWSMMEVFLIGILVALVKLSALAEIVPGLAIWTFAVLILVLAAATVSLDPRAVWRRVPVSP
jgi:paraquat-inducible protein A